MFNLGVVILAMLLTLYPPRLQADPPLIQTTTPFLSQSELEGMVKEVTAMAKTQNRDLEQASWRLRLACGHHALPPNWVAGVNKQMFSWSCLVAWERRLPVVTADTWAADSETLITGSTDGDAAATRESLRQRLYAFLQLKPPVK